MRKLKKLDGDILGSAFTTLISILAFFIIIMVFINYLNDSNVPYKVKMLSREYILRIESKGYLDTTSESELRDELEELGIYDINFGSTTKTKGSYGSEVILEIYGKDNLKEYSILSSFDLNESTKVLDIHEKQTSTGKH